MLTISQQPPDPMTYSFASILMTYVVPIADHLLLPPVQGSNAHTVQLADSSAYLMQASCNRDTHVDDLDPGSILDGVFLDAAKSEVLVSPAQTLMQLVQHMHQKVLLLWVEGQHICTCYLPNIANGVGACTQSLAA